MKEPYKEYDLKKAILKNMKKIPTGIWQRFYFYGGRIPSTSREK